MEQLAPRAARERLERLDSGRSPFCDRCRIRYDGAEIPAIGVWDDGEAVCVECADDTIEMIQLNAERGSE